MQSGPFPGDGSWLLKITYDTQIFALTQDRYGRQVILFGTYAALTAFNAGAAGSRNIETLLILRFFAGGFGSSALTNSGGVIADLFPASERGLALSLFAAAVCASTYFHAQSRS